MRRNEWMAVLAMFGVLGVSACQPSDQAQQTQEPAAQAPTTEQPAAAPEPTGPLPEGVTPEMVAQGRQIFEGQGICFTCHNMDAKGGPLAPDLTDGEWLWIDPAQGDVLTQVETLIRTGVAQPKQYPAPMPPMGGAQLNDEQIRDVAAYVVSLSQS